MTTELKKLIKNRALATYKVKSCLGILNRTEISGMLNISRATLKRRFTDDSWKLKELELIIEKLPSID